MRGGSGAAPAEPIEPAALGRFRNALVAAAQNGDAPSARLQRARKFLHHRRLARAAHGQVADADDKAAERALAKDAFAIKEQAQLDEAGID